jgi:hypothetical protein
VVFIYHFIPSSHQPVQDMSRKNVRFSTETSIFVSESLSCGVGGGSLFFFLNYLIALFYVSAISLALFHLLSDTGIGGYYKGLV